MSHTSGASDNDQTSQAIAELRALIESGSVAIIQEEDATQDVRQVQGAISTIGDGNVTSRAEYVLKTDNESMLWQEAPSLTLMVWPLMKLVFFTILAFAVVAMAAIYTTRTAGDRLTQLEQQQLATPIPAEPSVDKTKKSSKAEIAAANEQRTARKAALAERAQLLKRSTGWKDFFWYEYARNAFIAYLLYKFIRRFAELKTTNYRMSSQRLIVDRGILSRTSIPYELHTLGNAVIHQPLILRLCGIANVYVSGILLQGLRNAEVVRDLIRNAGQLEAQRTEKIRWR